MLLSGAAASRAAGPGDHTAVVTGFTTNAQVGDRLRTELSVAGWNVVELQPASGDSGRGPEEVARRLEAAVAIRLGSQGGVELWILDSSNGALVAHEVVSVAPGEGPDVVTLRVVEVLRARGLEVGGAPARPASGGDGAAPAAPVPPPESGYATAGTQVPPGAAASPAPPAASPAVVREGKAAVRVGAAPMVGWSPGLGVAPSVELTAHYAPDERWAAGLEILLPLGAATFDVPAGAVTIHWGFAGASAERRWSTDSVDLVVGAAAGALAQRVAGTAGAPYRGEAGWITTGALLGSLGIRVDLSRTFRLCAETAAGLTLPRPVVIVGDDRVAAWGTPMLLASLGLEWDAWRSPGPEPP